MEKVFSFKNGFTLIELSMTIAIIGILATIVFLSVQTARQKAIIARVNMDVSNIATALTLFKDTYGKYPEGQQHDNSYSKFFSSQEHGGGEPSLLVNGTRHYLSEFYQSDWVGHNANFLNPTTYYYVYLSDYNNDGKIGCGFVELKGNGFYGRQYVICNDCDCGALNKNWQNCPYRFIKYY